MWQAFWSLRVNDRLNKWKEFRQTLSGLPLEQAVAEVNNMWSTAPYVNYYLSPDDIKTWPDPWELLAENFYCELAKALGIVYTIYFTSHKNIPMEIRVYYDYEAKDRYNVVWLDNGKYILNYWPYEIVNTKQITKNKEIKMLHRYPIEDLELDQY